MKDGTQNGASHEHLTPEEVAKRCGVTRRTVYAWLRSGRLKVQDGHVVGTNWRIPEKAVQEFLQG